MMIPFIDFTGKLTASEVIAQNLEQLTQENTFNQTSMTINGSMKLVQYNYINCNPGLVATFPYVLATINHNLGYVPQVSVYQKFSFTNPTTGLPIDTFQALPVFFSGYDGGATGAGVVAKLGYTLTVSADVNSIYITLNNGFASGVSVIDWQFRYYIFSQPQMG